MIDSNGLLNDIYDNRAAPERAAVLERTAPERTAPGRGLFLARTWWALGQTLQLSPRELEIAQAVFDDRSEAAIARDLELSVHTVHTYTKRLYQKLGASSRVELVCIVVAAEREMC